MKMRILITGGFGFVGGRLGQHLQRVGHQVVLGSRTLHPKPDWLPEADIVCTEWNVPDTLERICSNVDIVVHTAGMNAQDCSSDPVAALEFNGLATARLVKAATNKGVKRFIYISTAHVYSAPLTGEINETTCLRNLHPYAATHRAGEDALFGLLENENMKGVVLRLSNAFGSPAHKDVNCWMLLVNDLCKQAVQSGKITLRSSGLQIRDFISMKEVCRVVEYIICCDLVCCQSNVFNVGSGMSQSVLDMAKLIQQRCKTILGSEIELHRPEPRVGEKLQYLKYCTDGLSEIGFNFVVDQSNEIDKLLLFCHNIFYK